ncbi:phosphotransferase family protein [Ilumatobacter nonamiensis]|uniref:phosphotransferase family protein n=1 Tax=Ilumatobacter nonamiensis TaxID=467093 RepID=UPI000A078010|nr:phosphotransferase [Ilumatobacter nonamiensis]
MVDGPVDVPQTLNGVTAGWMTEHLGRVIDAVEVTQIGEGSGFMGQLARVTITSSDPAAPASVIVKMPTLDPGARAIGEMMGVWVREHSFYRDIAPDVDIRIPTALVNIVDPPLLVLEDLRPGVVGDHVAGATIGQAERAIDVIAQHHAQWFEDPRLARLEWLPGLDDPAILTLQDTFAIGWPLFLERYGDVLPARCLRWCEEFVPGIPEWIERHYDDPATLIHGDFRLDNLLFYDDGSVGVIDWQLCMRAPGQTDIVYFCANNLDVETRELHDLALIDRYVAGLHRHGVPEDKVTVDQVRRGYLEGLVFYAVSFGASLLTIDPANERGTALFDALVERTFAALEHHSAGLALGFADA